MPIAAMACEQRWCPGQGSLPPPCLGGLHEALPQEPDARTALALTLEQLQTVDMALDGTV
jgi:hypothetical protein